MLRHVTPPPEWYSGPAHRRIADRPAGRARDGPGGLGHCL